MGYKLINEQDNVKVSLDDGHKYAVKDIQQGDKIIKYGFPIGIALCDIKKDEKVHSHNLRTALSGIEEYEYSPEINETEKTEPVKISAYQRKDGKIGIRNDIWIINTVGCINKTAERLALLTGSFSFPHPYGCSQLGDDLTRTQKILCDLIKHPNSGGVLVLGLGCENNNITELKKALGKYDRDRVRFLNIQDTKDEMREGIRLINELKAAAENDIRTEVPLNKLVLGMKCGGSDGFSGITANPLCGKITDKLVSMGGTSVLTEVPEMFGAERILMNRCINEDVFNKTVRLINGYKEYFISNGQPVSENPSPGNLDGGITTLEEKSLGCIQKGGTAVITDVLQTGESVTENGLNLLDGPGNDMIAVTNLTAAGCHMILFTTGRGTPLGAPVPTVKISSNTVLAENKPHWIDYDAESGNAEELFDLIIKTANGKETKNEIQGFREIAIFKDGVTL